MNSAVKPIPDEYTAVTPYLLLEDVEGFICFAKAALDAIETERHLSHDGKVMHAEVRIGGAAIMMGAANDAFPPMPASIYLYMNDCDDVYRKSLAAGATSIMEPVDMFYGDRHGGVRDPFGNCWWIATHIEDVAPEERERRAAEFAAKMKANCGN